MAAASAAPAEPSHFRLALNLSAKLGQLRSLGVSLTKPQSKVFGGYKIA